MFPQAVRPSGRSPSRCRWTPPKGMISIHPDPSIWLWGTPEGPCHVGAWEGNRLPCILHIEDSSHVRCNVVINDCCFFLTPSFLSPKFSQKIWPSSPPPPDLPRFCLPGFHKIEMCSYGMGAVCPGGIVKTAPSPQNFREHCRGRVGGVSDLRSGSRFQLLVLSHRRVYHHQGTSRPGAVFAVIVHKEPTERAFGGTNPSMERRFKSIQGFTPRCPRQVGPSGRASERLPVYQHHVIMHFIPF